MKIKKALGTMSLTALLTMNLFIIVILILSIATLTIYLGIDGGFLVKDGLITIGGGLGLAMVKKIIELHEGNILSRYGSGKWMPGKGRTP